MVEAFQNGQSITSLALKDTEDTLEEKEERTPPKQASPLEAAPLSYGVFLNDIQNFKRSGTYSGGDFNVYDTPANKYFKLFFYFWNNNARNDSINNSGGLLAPTWELGLKNEDLWEVSSAYSYLKINDEEERAEKLQQFVKLLSNISTYSPWYFNSIEGLGEALDRKQVMEENFQFDASRKKISIKCLPDAYDDRIGTLLDLYKDIVWSWQMKREIIPSNLRKFDMGLYIFESPIANIHLGNTTVDKLNKSNYLTSYKYIEFHNCEIDYNSARTGLSALSNNENGVHPEYTIDIFFDDCYEERYNEFMMRTIGDMIAIDSAFIVFDSNNEQPTFNGMSAESKAQQDTDAVNTFYERSDVYKTNVERGKETKEYKLISSSMLHTSKPNEPILPDHRGRIAQMATPIIPVKGSKQLIDVNKLIKTGKDFVSSELKKINIAGKSLNSFTNPNFVSNAMNELIGAGKAAVTSKIKSIITGNLHGLSLTKLADQINAFTQGHLWTTVDAVKKKTTNDKTAQTQHVTSIGNLFKAKSAINNI